MGDLQRVWRAVLERAMLDAMGVGIVVGVNKMSGGAAARLRHIERMQADSRRWIGSRDFEAVCWMGGLEPEAVLTAWRDGRIQRALVEGKTVSEAARARWADVSARAA